jgi:hypothetical protein
MRVLEWLAQEVTQIVREVRTERMVPNARFELVALSVAGRA